MKSKKSIKWFALVALAVASLATVSACAGEDFAGYDGETIEIVNPFSATGGTGRWLALLMPYLEEHIPGEPTVTQTNQTGGGGLNGPNYFENNTTSDGLSLLASSGSNVFPYLFNQDGVQFDYNDYTLVLGSPVGGVVYASADSGVTDISSFCASDDLIYGAIAATGLDIVPLYTFHLLGFEHDNNIRLVLGYEGRGDARADLEIGELSLDYQTSAAYRDNVAPRVESGDAIALYTFGILADGEVVRDPTYPNLPHFGEVYQQCEGSALAGTELDAYTALLAAGFAAQKNLWVKSDAPSSAIDDLLEGARAIVADPQFNVDKQVEVGAYDFSVGAAAQANFDTASNISDSAFNAIRTFLDEVHNVQIPARQ